MSFVLLVDDNAGDARLVREGLATWQRPPEASHVPTGGQALRFLRHETPFEAAPRPDLIILDLHLPDMSGHDVLASVKAEPELAAIPIVVLSASPNPDDRLVALERGASLHIVKQADIDHHFEHLRDLEQLVRNIPATKSGQ